MKYITGVLVVITVLSCKNKSEKAAHTAIVFKGLYSFGPGEKSFQECANGHESWVIDNSAQLELQYSQLNIEKPFTPVYIEVKGKKVRSDKQGQGAGYDSTLVVSKLIKITKDIPKGNCN